MDTDKSSVVVAKFVVGGWIMLRLRGRGGGGGEGVVVCCKKIKNKNA